MQMPRRFLAVLVPTLSIALAAHAAAPQTGRPIASRFNADPSPHFFPAAKGDKFYHYATDDPYS